MLLTKCTQHHRGVASLRREWGGPVRGHTTKGP